MLRGRKRYYYVGDVNALCIITPGIKRKLKNHIRGNLFFIKMIVSEKADGPILKGQGRSGYRRVARAGKGDMSRAGRRGCLSGRELLPKSRDSRHSGR